MTPSRILIILNYQRAIPPFMQMEIKEAQKHFDRVIYVTRKLVDDNRDSINFDNVNVVEIPDNIRYTNFIVSPLTSLFSGNVTELTKSITKDSIKRYFTHNFCSRCLYQTAKGMIKQSLSEGHQIYVLAGWMSSEATAAARLKKRYSEIKSYSFAHSFEVIPNRNPLIHQSFHAFHHKWLDKVYFISSNVMSLYLEEMANEKIKQRYGNNIGVRHLGSSKTSNCLNPENKSDVFQIVTCSRIDDNKRLGRIVEALYGWNDKKIHWTVIGDGTHRKEVETAAIALAKQNPKISVTFVGQKSNTEVQTFYQENPVDLFINVSRSEGLPVSIMEAISYGIPVMATDVGGTSEIVTERSGLLLSPEFTDEEFRTKLMYFTNLPLDKYRQLRTSAFQLWGLDFNIDRTASIMYAEWTNN